MAARWRIEVVVLALAVGAALARPLVAASHAAPAPVARMAAHDGELVTIPPGHYRPLMLPSRADFTPGRAPRASRTIAVHGFKLARYAVTNAEFLAFVLEHPEWRRSRVSRLYADDGYLRHWRGDLDFGGAAVAASPVVNVSWFAARAYCAAHGRRLPTVDEWEYVAAADERHADATRDPAFQDRLRAWYSRPTPARLPPVGSTFVDVYGVADLHGLVWEWTLDFSSALVTGESRADATLDRSLYCGAGAAAAGDFRDYAAFMRYALRSSLAARYCVADLGFREASDAAPAPPRAERSSR